MMQQTNPRIRLFPVLLKATFLFALFNFGFIFLQDASLAKFSLYNSVFPGRERLPYGEVRESYNLSLFDIDAMFASHAIAGAEKTPDEYRVLLIGDSSVWGTLLKPEETLAGQLNAKAITACGKSITHQNLLGQVGITFATVRYHFYHIWVQAPFSLSPFSPDYQVNLVWHLNCWRYL